MARLLPYEADYTILDKCRTAETVGLYIIGGLSVLIPLVLLGTNPTLSVISDILNIINLIAIVGYYILNIVTETFLYPATARKRRRGF